MPLSHEEKHTVVVAACVVTLAAGIAIAAFKIGLAVGLEIDRSVGALPQEAPGRPQEGGTALVAPEAAMEAPPSADAILGAPVPSLPDPGPWMAEEALADPLLSPEQDTREGSLALLLQHWTQGIEDEATIALVDEAIEREAPRLVRDEMLCELQDEVARYWRAQFAPEAGIHVGHLMTAPVCNPECGTAPGAEEERLRLEAGRDAMLELMRERVRLLTMESVLRDALEPVEEAAKR